MKKGKAQASSPGIVFGLVFALGAGCGLLGFSPPAAAEVREAPRAADQSVTAEVEAEKKQSRAEKMPYRGTSFTVRPAVSSLSFNREADLTYNPMARVAFKFSPYWWFTKHLYFAGEVMAHRELTEADYTTYANQLLMENISLEFGASEIWKIPVLGLDLSGAIDFALPTSQYAQAQTAVLGTGTSISIARAFTDLPFDYPKSLQFGYQLRVGKTFHQYTTMSYDKPVIADCSDLNSGCEQFLNNGSRNISWSLRHYFTASLVVVDGVTIDGAFATITGYLYPLAQDERVSFSVVNPVNERYYNYFRVAATVKPMPAFDVAVGASSIDLFPQLKPDGSYRSPVFNRYTNIFVAFRVDMAGTLGQVTALGDE